MFIRKLFGKKPPKAPEPVFEELSVDSLEARVDGLKREKLAETNSRLSAILGGLSEERETFLKELKALSEAEPTEDVYAGLRKSAFEARRLLAEKLTRATTYIQKREEFSLQDLKELDDQLAKTVNLTTNAIVTHGRYVRVLFGPPLTAIELRLRRMHGLIKEAHTLIEGTLEKMRSFDSVSSKISSHRQLLHRIQDMRNSANSLKGQVEVLEGLIKEEDKKLEQLVNSEEFKGLDASRRELERIELEVAQVGGAASSAISELNRPLRKMEKLVRVGEYRVDRELIEVLESCIENPLEVLSSEEKIASTHALLKKLLELLEGGKISMGDHERRKRIELARELLEEKKLKKLKQRLVDLEKEREIQKRACEQTPLLKQKTGLEESTQKHRSELDRLRTTIEELNRESQIAEGDVGKNLHELEGLATEAVGTKIVLTS